MERKRFNFSDAERERVLAAVRAAESGTTGEIVPCVVAACKNYRWVHPFMSLMGIAIATAALMLVHAGRSWDVHPEHMALWQSLGAVAGWLLSCVPAIKRALIPSSWMASAVHMNSLAAFVESKLFETKDRNGVLVFVSLFERRVEILADRGINSVVPQGYWDERVRQIVDGVHSGRAIDALNECIAEIGKTLTQKFPGHPDDTNELPDHLRES